MYPLVYLPLMTEDEDCNEEDEDEETIRPGDRLITGSADTSIKVWDLFNGECLEVNYCFHIWNIAKIILKLDLEKSHWNSDCFGN